MDPLICFAVWAPPCFGSWDSARSARPTSFLWRLLGLRLGAPNREQTPEVLGAACRAEGGGRTARAEREDHSCTLNRVVPVRFGSQRFGSVFNSQRSGFAGSPVRPVRRFGRFGSAVSVSSSASSVRATRRFSRFAGSAGSHASSGPVRFVGTGSYSNLPTAFQLQRPTR